MTVDPKTVAVGKVYLTAKSQLRKVVEVTDGKVKYSAKSAKQFAKFQGKMPPQGVAVEKFAEAVDKEVDESYHEDFDKKDGA